MINNDTPPMIRFNAFRIAADNIAAMIDDAR